MVAADTASAMRVFVAEASAPQTTLPSARLAWFATRFMATARARTQAGALLCVPAERLASTPTHAMPAPQVPTTASAVMLVMAINAAAATQRKTADTTMLFSERRLISRG